MENLRQLKTFEDACKVEGLDAEKVIPDFSCYPEKNRKAMVAHAKLVIIAQAANKLENEGNEWIPDWNDFDQYKYYPWFEMGGSSGFRFVGYDHWFSHSTVGSRLCFISRNVATYIGETFVDLYKEYFTL
jgi:hypothetical protein